MSIPISPPISQSRTRAFMQHTLPFADAQIASFAKTNGSRLLSSIHTIQKLLEKESKIQYRLQAQTGMPPHFFQKLQLYSANVKVVFVMFSR